MDVLTGLRSDPKYLFSKYIYDKEGDFLFEQIMNSPEYYPSRCEMEIFKEQTSFIANALVHGKEKIYVIELGPGDIAKSIHLIRELCLCDVLGTYIPIDISRHIIELLKATFIQEFPSLKFQGFTGEYFEKLPEAIKASDNKRVILFLGGNATNFPPEVTTGMFNRLNAMMQRGDVLMTGFDLKKDPRIILAAYNDREGWTARFNLNLLKRINRELGGNFVLENFSHYPNYDPQTGACKSYLVSEKLQEVNISGSNIVFRKGEPVFIEISQKYDEETISKIAREVGFVQKSIFKDRNKYFADVIWQKP